MPGHGGRRAGAGRKPNPENVKVELKRYYDIEALAAAGLTPLEVMVEAMRFFRAQAAQEQKQQNPDRQSVRTNLQIAANIAKDAAPYMHPRVVIRDELDPLAHLGKKEIRNEEARTAGDGTLWSEIIKTPPTSH